MPESLLSRRAAGAQRKRLVAAGALLLAWHAGESMMAHPDYLAYFNQAARGREQRVLADSNLDWGQDLARLAQLAQSKNLAGLELLYFGAANPEKFGFVETAEPGWLAVSVNHAVGLTFPKAELGTLALRSPDGKVGRSIYLYQLRPQDEAPYLEKRRRETGSGSVLMGLR